MLYNTTLIIFQRFITYYELYKYSHSRNHLQNEQLSNTTN